VFKRHPVINVNGVVEEIGKRLNGKFQCSGWELGATRELSRELHVIRFGYFPGAFTLKRPVF
jgi:hypothetical protein